jgi:hypothetical protein
VYPYDVWDDDPSSPLYNEWVDDRYADPGADPEPMDVSAYDYGAVIGYNTARTPGLGSAIFLYINIGMPTAGCVTLPEGELLEILRWLNPAASPRIAVGVRTPGTDTGMAGRAPGIWPRPPPRRCGTGTMCRRPKPAGSTCWSGWRFRDVQPWREVSAIGDVLLVPQTPSSRSTAPARGCRERSREVTRRMLDLVGLSRLG